MADQTPDPTVAPPAKKTRSRKPRLFHKILELAKVQGGRLSVDDPKLLDIMTQNGKDTMYRLPTQMSGIRRVEKIEVTAIRKGKKVIAYDFPVYKALDASADLRDAPEGTSSDRSGDPDAMPEAATAPARAESEPDGLEDDVVESDATAPVTA